MSDATASKTKTNSKILTAVGMCLIYFIALRTGAAFVASGLNSSDTCWLVELGQHITEGGIPKADPFTYTIGAAGSSGPPYVVYQWLFEALLYATCRDFSPNGATIIGGIIMAVTLLCVSFRACIRANAPRGWTLFATLFASITGAVRSSLRPEVVSVLFISIALYILQEFRIEAARISSEKTAAADQEAEGVQGNARGLDIDWRRVALLAILAAIWCNMHTGFIYEILLLLIYSAAFLAEDLKAKWSLTRASKTLLASLGASICATLINPYGPGLWAYLPHLFFAPINRFIIELQPIGADSFLDPSVVLSTLLPVFCFGAIAYRSVKLRIANSMELLSPVRLSSALIALLPFSPVYPVEDLSWRLP